MASGAGVNRVGQQGGVVLLSLQPGITAATTPLAGYGTIGVNDSGIQMLEGIGLTKWLFQLCPAPGGTTVPTGVSVSIYGTIDPSTYNAWLAVNAGPANYGPPTMGDRGSTITPSGSWFLLPGPAEQGGTGNMANPLTATAPLLLCSLPLVAVRAVVTTATTLSAAANVYGFCVP